MTILRTMAVPVGVILVTKGKQNNASSIIFNDMLDSGPQVIVLHGCQISILEFVNYWIGKEQIEFAAFCSKFSKFVMEIPGVQFVQ